MFAMTFCGLSFFVLCKIVLLNLVLPKVSAKNDVYNRFHGESIDADLNIEGPDGLLRVNYDSNFVYLGTKLKPAQVKDAPKLNWRADYSLAYYTLVMLDPDDPSYSEPTNREFLHWLVINIPGNRLTDGTVLADYVGSAPPRDSGFHRYIFLVFRQQFVLPADIRPHLAVQGTESAREHFKIADFAQQHNLTNPIAGNFYKAQWDHYVPTLEALLNG